MMKLLVMLSLLFTFTAHAQITAGEAKALQPEALNLWERRVEASSLSEALSKFEKIHEGIPEDMATLEYLARGYFLMGEFHTFDKDHKMKMFEKSKNYGMKGMSLNPEFKKLAEDKIEKAISKLTEKEVPVTFWTAASLGKWSKLNGVMASLKYKDQMLAMISRVGELKPDYFYGAVPRFWGGFYALAPGFAGGDMKKSKKNFHQAMEMAPEYLGTKVLYAETYLVEEDKEKEFKKALEEVLAAPLGPKEIHPENTLEKQKAEKLLTDIKKLF